MDFGMLAKYLWKFLITHYLFVIAIYEVVQLTLIGKLLSLTKSGLDKRTQLTGIEKITATVIKSQPPYPHITIRQIFRNGSEVRLRISKVDAILKANDRDLDRIQYTPDFPTTYGNQFKTKKGTVVPPNDLDYWIKFETTKLNQCIPNYKDQDIKITIGGVIEFATRTTKVERELYGEGTINPEVWK